jgi:hypothetical protein
VSSSGDLVLNYAGEVPQEAYVINSEGELEVSCGDD